MKLFAKLHEDGQTLIVVTHEHDIAEHAHRVVTLRDGVISSDVTREQFVAASAR
jgi:putative ABC transport system ATP-binding protein